ncbi:MFS transporter [Halomonas sp. HNIBRBA4712]|uniref:MFS transporter n=1 Tax=Halomonas sp. HNIBRBA4712 TaxID=3373087 RepID=UPI0037465560
MANHETSPRSATIFLGAALAFLTTMMGTTLPTPLYPIYQDEMGFSHLMVTVIFAVYAVGVISALLITGRWSDQLGRRPLLFAGLVLSGVSDVVFWQADGLGSLLVGRVLSGLSAGIFTGTATIAVMELAPRRWGNTSTLIATAANMGGLGLGPILAGVLATLFAAPLMLPFGVHFVLVLIAVACIWRAPEMVDRPEHIKLPLQKPKIPREVRSVFIPSAIAAFAGFMVCGFYTAAAPSFLGQELGYTNHALVGGVAGLLFIASTVGQMLQGRLPEASRLPTGCGVLFVGVLIVAWGIADETLTGFVLGAIVAGIGQGVAFRAGLGAVSAASSKENKSAVVSTFFVIAYVAISLPVVGIGLMGTVAGQQATALTFDLIVAVLCLVSLGLLLKRRAIQ